MDFHGLTWTDNGVDLSGSDDDKRNGLIGLLHRLGMCPSNQVSQCQAMDTGTLLQMCPRQGAHTYRIDTPNSCFPGVGFNYITTAGGINGQLGKERLLVSQNSLWILTPQADGNLVRYKGSLRNQDLAWASGSFEGGDQDYNLILQTDGNLVLYRGTQARWAASHHGLDLNWVGPPPHQLWMKDDGDLVLFRADGTIAWTLGSFGHSYPQQYGDSYDPDGRLCSTTGARDPFDGHLLFAQAQQVDGVCEPWCQPCRAGHGLKDSQCAACPPGTYKRASSGMWAEDVMSNFSLCTQCPGAMTSVAGSTSVLDCFLNCSQGLSDSDLVEARSERKNSVCNGAGAKLSTFNFSSEIVQARPIIQLSLTDLIQNVDGSVLAKMDGTKIFRCGVWYQDKWTMQPSFARTGGIMHEASNEPRAYMRFSAEHEQHLAAGRFGLDPDTPDGLTIIAMFRKMPAPDGVNTVWARVVDFSHALYFDPPSSKLMYLTATENPAEYEVKMFDDSAKMSDTENCVIRFNLEDGMWHTVVARYSEHDLKLKIDKVDSSGHLTSLGEASCTIVKPFEYREVIGLIGRSSWGAEDAYFNGDIAGVAVYGGCISDAQAVAQFRHFMTLSGAMLTGDAFGSLLEQGSPTPGTFVSAGVDFNQDDGGYVRLDELQSAYLDFGPLAFNLGSDDLDGGFTVIVAFRPVGPPFPSTARARALSACERTNYVTVVPQSMRVCLP